MLNRRSLFFLVLAVIFGVAAMGLTRSYLAKAAAAPVLEEIGMTQVALAARDLPVGAAIGSEDIRLVEWPETHAPRTAFASESALRGRVLRHPLSEGDPIFPSLLLPEGAVAGLVSMIAEGHRAVSVKVDAVIGVAGFIKPGTRVDVLATLRRDDNKHFSKVVLQDVRVLAVDQALEDTTDGEPKVVNVVTLEVKPNNAERLIHAAHEGRLQLALRNPGDEEVVNTRAVRAGDLYGAVKKAAARPVKAKRNVQKEFIELIKGTERSQSEYSPGK